MHDVSGRPGLGGATGAQAVICAIFQAVMLSTRKFVPKVRPHVALNEFHHVAAKVVIDKAQARVIICRLALGAF